MTDTDHDLDGRLAALLRDPALPPADPAFADRVVALAHYDRAVRRRRRARARRLAGELAGLLAALGSFAALARIGTLAAGAGDSLPLASPAMLGVTILVLWGAIVVRSPARA